jgi:hypothetical protein
MTVAYANFDTSQLATVRLANNTGKTIMSIHVSPSDSSQWGPDLLDASQTLANGSSHEFVVLSNSASASYDILLIDSDGYSYTKMGQNISRSRTNTFAFARGDRGSVENLATVTVSLKNGLDGYEIIYLFFSPSDSEHWGPDVLPSTVTLSDGKTHSFLVPVDGVITFNVRAIDEDGDSYSFDIDLKPGMRNANWTIDLTDMD